MQKLQDWMLQYLKNMRCLKKMRFRGQKITAYVRRAKSKEQDMLQCSHYSISV